MKLFRKTSKGKINFAEFSIQGDTYTVTTGEVGTTKPVAHSKTCVGKNIGKVNETSPREQAEIECQAKVTKKLKEGYFSSIEEAENTEVILPMLAKEYGKEKHKIDWNNNVVAQAKLDGMRCLAFIDGKGGVKLISRKNTDIMIEHGGSMQHIVDELSNIKEECILDGELYAHGLTFQENMKLIKKKRDNSSDIEFCIYDKVMENASWLQWRCDYFPFESKHVTAVDFTQVFSEEELIECHKKFIQQGYEGTMVRHSNEGYKINGRSSQLLKYKDFIDMKVTIIDVVGTEGRPTHGTPVLRDAAGNEFRAGVKGSHEYRENLLINKQDYIGKEAELRFFEYTDTGMPRFPVMVGMRLD